MYQLVDSAVPHFIRRVIPSIADSGRSLLNTDVTQVVSAITGKPVDILYSRLTGISCSFFSKGWGNLRVVDLKEDLQYLHSEWPSMQLQIDWKLQHEGYQDRRPFKVYEGRFRTPCVKRVWDALPPESRQGVVQLLVPASGVCNAGVVHLAATGDQGFTRRAKLAAPLLSQGVAGLILESPFYGCRKPPHQLSSKLDRVSDLLALGWATIFESMHLVRWLQQNGYENAGLSGTSMGGVHACLAASLYPEPVACVPFLAPRSAAVAYCDGAMWPVTAWQALLKDVDDRNNDLVRVLEDATRPHGYAVRLKPARISPQDITAPLTQHRLTVPVDASSRQAWPAHTSTVNAATPSAQPAATDTQSGTLLSTDWLSGLLPLPSLSLDSSWLNTATNNWIVSPGVTSTSEPSSTCSVSSGTSSVQHADGSVQTRGSGRRHNQPASVSMHETESQAGRQYGNPHVHAGAGSRIGAGTQQNGSSTESSSTCHVHYQPVQVYSRQQPDASRLHPPPYRQDDTWDAGWEVGYDEQWMVRYGHKHDTSTPSSHAERRILSHSGGGELSHPGGRHAVNGEGSTGLDAQQMVAATMERRMQQEAEALEQLIGSCEAAIANKAGSRTWADMQSARAEDVVQLQRHLSLVKLRAVLETFTDITRFPVPQRPDAAILIAAQDDAYVNKESVHEVHKYWAGSELRVVPGGHVSAFLTQQAAVREAVLDSLDRLNQSKETM